MKNSVFTPALLSWYLEYKRDLPWRHTMDPYKIWLSEIILQQTRVAQGLPYYEKFVDRFPKVEDLAGAGESEILRLWQGLGYYSRARNLLKCAQVVTSKYHGAFPDNYRELVTLPGVGDYTAAAIATFAFKQAVPVVDGNVFRVLARVWGIYQDISQGKSRQVFKTYSSALMDLKHPDLYNQAIMEFGALQCTPAQPKCPSCPFQGFCQAYLKNEQSKLPVKSKKLKTKNRYFYYYVFRHHDSILMKERQHKDIWRGLYDFYLLEHVSDTDPLQLLEEKLPEHTWLKQSIVQDPIVTYKHKLTHQEIHATFLSMEIPDQQAIKDWQRFFGLQKYSLKQVVELPKPILINNYLKAAIF